MTAIEKLLSSRESSVGSVQTVTAVAAAGAMVATSSWLFWRAQKQPHKADRGAAAAAGRLGSHTARADVGGPRQWVRPFQLDALILESPSCDPLSAVASLSTSSSSFCARCAAVNPGVVVVLHDDMSPDRRRAEWSRARRLLPCDTAKQDQRRRLSLLFDQFREAAGRDGAGSAVGGGVGVDGGASRWCASIRFADLYHGLVSVLHLNRLSQRLRVIVERGYLEAHTRCTCERHALRDVTYRRGWGPNNNNTAAACDERIQEVLQQLASPGAPPPSLAALSDRRISYTEFRLILTYLYDYFTLFTHVQEAHAQMIEMSKREWPSVLVRLADCGVTVDNAEELFDRLDRTQQGRVTVDALCAWAAGERLWRDGEAGALAK